MMNKKSKYCELFGKCQISRNCAIFMHWNFFTIPGEPNVQFLYEMCDEAGQRYVGDLIILCQWNIVYSYLKRF